MKLYLIAGAAVVIVAFSALIKFYGVAQYKSGQNACIAENNAQIVEVTKKTQSTRIKHEKNALKIPDSDLDAELITLGIMRPESAR